MKIILIAFISIMAFACSGEVDNKQAPKSKIPATENKISNALSAQPQSKQPEEHISGGGESRISGAPSSSHISGQ